jgi:cell wall-associated NlpC family hydrolase
VRLHTRVSVATLAAVTIGAGALTTATAAPSGPSSSTTLASASTVTVTRTTATSTSAAAQRAARIAAVNRATRAKAAKILAHRAALRAKAVKIALRKVAQDPPYVAGAAGPNAFDCSGFTSWVWKTAGKSIPRTSWGQQSGLRRVSRSAARPGDIALYMNGAHHAEIFIGNGRTVGCSNSRTDCGVKGLSGWYADHFTGFYRVV